MMKHAYLKTHWTPEEAHFILSFLDELRDLIWSTYGSEITEFYQNQCQSEESDYAEATNDTNPF